MSWNPQTDVETAYTIVQPTSSYSASAGELVITNGHDVTLPPPSSGMSVAVINTGSGPITLSASSIEGGSSVSVPTNEFLFTVATESAWYIISDRSSV
jgi:hypothetical protein